VSGAPSFSLVINTLNRGAYINDAITGVLQLDYPDFELIVVNGPSTDHTEQVLARWAGTIKHCHCDAANLSISRNVGIAAAAGDIVAFLDDDAVPHPDWLNRIAPHYARPHVGAVGGFTVDNTGVRWQVRKTICDRFGNARYVDDLFDERRLNFPRTPFYPSLLGTNSSFRRAALQAIGGFDHTYAYLLDETDVCLRLVDAGWQVLYESEALVFHQFAESHVRSSSRKPRTLYPSAVSKAYFIGRHGDRDGHARQAGMLDSYRDELLTANRWMAEHGQISANHRASLDLDVTEGIATGTRRAITARAERKDRGDLVQPVAPAPFLPIGRVPALRVALVTQDYPPHGDAGIARWTAMLARGLADLGVHVHVITRASDAPSRRMQDGIWVHRIAHKGSQSNRIARLYAVPEHPIAEWISAVTDEVRFIKTFGLDLVSFPIWDLEALPVLDDPDLACVISLHTTYGLARPFKPEWNERIVYGRKVVDRMIAAEAAALARARFILANSDTIVAQVEALYGLSLAGRCSVIPHGTTDLLEAAGTAITDRPADDQVLRVVVPARFELRKGYDLALHLAHALEGHARVRFDFAGEGLSPEVRTRALRDSGVKPGELTNATFHGLLSRPALEALYRAADVVVMPSRFESFGLVAIEAMSAGAPVIALAAGALPEVVAHGQTGWLLGEGDFVAQAAALLKRLAQDRSALNAMRSQAYAAFRARYTNQAMAATILEFYRAAQAARQEQA
jgi:glycosyltransferase involved in cell wall biosynthesis